MKKILLALTVLILASACYTVPPQGNAMHQEMPGYADNVNMFASTNACHKACMQLGYEQGTCKPVGSFAGAEQEIGSCVIDYSVTCNSPAGCSCYCYRKPGHTDPRWY